MLKVPELPARTESGKFYNLLPLGAAVSRMFCVSLVGFAAITLCVVSQRVLTVMRVECDSRFLK
jgi:hypothetical protein